MYRRIILLSCLAILVSASAAMAQQDWPRWMGSDRTNTWNETGLIESFPEGGPKILWRTPIAGGYSGAAIADGKVLITDFVTDANVKIGNFERREFDGTERILCLNESDGKVIWKHEHAVRYTISYPSGPRCTPVIENDRVWTLGAEGNLFCFNLEDGKILWEKDLRKEYNTTAALWGYAGHPLIDGNNLITLAGGEGSHIVALNKNTGEEVWRALTAPEQGYSPPTIISAAGVRQLITCRPDAITSLNPEDGKEYWSVPYEATSNSIIMTPLHFGDYLYIGGYSKKSLLIKLNSMEPTATEFWRNKGRAAISAINVQPYLDVENQIAYGMDQTGDMRALKLPEGELLWATSEPSSKRRTGNGTVFIVREGKTDRFWLFNDYGFLIIAEITKDGYKEIDRTKVIEPSNNAFGRQVVWSMPAFANKRAYIRNDNEIICVDLAK
ncbi:outer membrane protein assembly factor BamB family protein [Mariniblastus fucicola]|uniref:Outer membrane biogenesis protein BamB n=1 Tax=Mariniblastus fucicola TaxID=980251 RepID=A0A5B9P8L1_9BACT|nr:PQQ-binding-like beta-propeller repeat protein [Mariniblastus fucicola]QEG22628.1 outer membrane biogenesis protein BamB [Mariniblastus fucicola]